MNDFQEGSDGFVSIPFIDSFKRAAAVVKLRSMELFEIVVSGRGDQLLNHGTDCSLYESERHVRDNNTSDNQDWRQIVCSRIVQVREMYDEPPLPAAHRILGSFPRWTTDQRVFRVDASYGAGLLRGGRSFWARRFRWSVRNKGGP
jgi:hypothetical protein